MENIDIRNIRMGKWHIPKSQDIFAEIDSKASFLSIGYFDMLEVKEASLENEHPLIHAYKNAYRMSLQSDPEYSVQEIKAFTNIISNEDYESMSYADRTGFTRNQIQRFWEDDDFILCISMVHLDLGQSIKETKNKIQKIFQHREYLYYITFDYSGIIILVKNIDIKQYVNCLLQLNYSSLGSILVRDTFSMFGLNKNKLKKLFDNYSYGKITSEKISDQNNYSISVNISVKDFGMYLKFKDELDAFELENNYLSQKMWMLGRHDISIVNEEANCDILWLTYVQYLLNKYSNENQCAFWSYESFIKIDSGISYETKKMASTDNSWKNADDCLNRAYERFCSQIKHYNYSTTYLIPITEVRESIRGILKNGFAEDFIICMYQSFIEFMNYLADKIDEEENNPNPNIRYHEEFDGCFNEYFACLNALVNSAMHSDRQFIQATAFNAIIYDVPPKIMAFYVAMVHNTQKILSTPQDSKYTFLLTPGFSDEISVKIISYTETELPKDRLIKVAINERSLYNPETVMRRMTHEIAHYVGDICRKRDERKAFIIKTLIFIILDQALDKDFPMDKEFYDLIDDINNLVLNVDVFNKDIFNAKHSNYSNNLSEYHYFVLEYIDENANVFDKFFCYVQKKIESLVNSEYVQRILSVEKQKGVFYDSVNLGKGLSDIDKAYLSNLILDDIKRNIKKVKYNMWKNQDETNPNTILYGGHMKDYMRVLISLYSETYADLQMILLLNISYEDYLMEFIQDEYLDTDKIEKSEEDLKRLAVISKLMQDVGLWGELNCSNQKAIILNRKIRMRQNAMHGLEPHEKEIMEMKKTLYQNESQLWKEKEIHVVFESNQTESAYPDILLYQYLYKCLIASADHLKEDGRISAILNLRKIVKIMHDFKDIHEVYETISSVIAEYKNELNMSFN